MTAVLANKPQPTKDVVKCKKEDVDIIVSSSTPFNVLSFRLTTSYYYIHFACASDAAVARYAIDATG